MTIYAKVGDVEMHVGDVLERLDALEDDKRNGRDAPTLAVTSPPYNLMKAYLGGGGDARSYHEYLEWSYDWLRSLGGAMGSQARLCLNVPLDTSLGGPRPIFADLVRMANEAGWRYRHSIVWNEGTVSGRTCWGSFMRATAPNVISPAEMIAVLHQGEWKREPRTSTIERDDFIAWTLGHWTFPGESAKRIGHPAPFPLELPRRLIRLYSFAEDIVIDPFGGSGTTNVVAQQLGRRSIYIDQSAEYAELAKQRLLAIDTGPAALLSSGMTNSGKES